MQPYFITTNYTYMNTHLIYTKGAIAINILSPYVSDKITPQWVHS